MVTIQLFEETGVIDLPTANTAVKIRDVRGGEVILIKALNGNAATVFIGDRNVSTSTGFELAAGQGVIVRIGKEIGENNHVELYAVSGTAGTDVTFFKIPFFADIK